MDPTKRSRPAVRAALPERGKVSLAAGARGKAGQLAAEYVEAAVKVAVAVMSATGETGQTRLMAAKLVLELAAEAEDSGKADSPHLSAVSGVAAAEELVRRRAEREASARRQEPATGDPWDAPPDSAS